MITNDNPVTLPETAFNGMWVRGLQLDQNRLVANMLPYDGADHILATGEKRVLLRDLPASRQSDPVLDAVVMAVHTEAARLSGNTSGFKQLSVMAPSPTAPVVARILFVDGEAYRVADCYARAGQSATFAGVFSATMAEIARQAGLTVE